MRRIYSYNLALLFYFLQGKTLSIPITNSIRKEALDSLIDNLESIVNDTNSTQDLFYREVEDDFYIVSLEEAQKPALKDYLQEYCTELVNDRLETRNQNVLKWNYARQEFIKRLAPLNLNCFISTNIYDMPQLAPELIKFDDGGYKLELKIDTAREHINEESFSFKCSLNLSIIVDKQEKIEPVLVGRRTDYPPQQREIFKAIIKEIKRTNMNVVDPYYLMDECTNLNNDNIDMAISRLNKEYREINNTDKKLLRKCRGSGLYDVLPNFIPPEEN